LRIGTEEDRCAGKPVRFWRNFVNSVVLNGQDERLGRIVLYFQNTSKFPSWHLERRKSLAKSHERPYRPIRPGKGLSTLDVAGSIPVSGS
jgi:hypothetical protein